MIEERVVVTHSEGEIVLVRAERQSACGQCSVKGGCGTSVLSKWLSPKMTQVRALNNINAQVGDTVVIGFSEESLLKGAFVVYLLPLLSMIIFSVCTHLLVPTTTNYHELYVLLSGVVGLIMAGLILKFFYHRTQKDKRYQPIVLRKVSKPISISNNGDHSAVQEF